MHDDSSDLEAHAELSKLEQSDVYSRYREEINPSHYVASKNLFPPLSDDLNRPIFDKLTGDDGLIFSGIGAVLDPDNKFVFPIVRAESTTVSRTDLQTDENIESQISAVSGEQLALVAGYQSRYNNRAAVAGSMQVCSDQIMRLSESNERFCKQLLDWTMQESGVLRAKHLRHNKQGDTPCDPWGSEE